MQTTDVRMKTILAEPTVLGMKKDTREKLRMYQGLIPSKKLDLLLRHLKAIRKEWEK